MANFGPKRNLSVTHLLAFQLATKGLRLFYCMHMGFRMYVCTMDVPCVLEGQKRMSDLPEEGVGSLLEL